MPNIQDNSLTYLAVWGLNMDSLQSTSQEAKPIYDEEIEKNYEANLKR